MGWKHTSRHRCKPDNHTDMYAMCCGVHCFLFLEQSTDDINLESKEHWFNKVKEDVSKDRHHHDIRRQFKWHITPMQSKMVLKWVNQWHRMGIVDNKLKKKGQSKRNQFYTKEEATLFFSGLSMQSFPPAITHYFLCSLRTGMRNW